MIPDRLYVEEHVSEHPLARKILSKLSGVPVTFVDDYKKIGKHKHFAERADQDKNSLAIAEKKGEVIKSIGRMGEGQYYLFHEIDCRYDCEYCYLQYYFQTKIPVVFVNRDRVLSEIEGILQKETSPYFHVGEICDSLAFDDITEFSADITELFQRYENGTIEFRTKSTNVENLLSVDYPPSNVIPSWTMSPQFIVETIEHKTPGLKQRLDAARRCQEAGYTVGIRLDPIFRYPGWEKHYRKMVRYIFTTLDPLNIDYASLGSVKLHKNLIDAVGKRFPDSMVILGEIIPGDDGKYRPIKFDRVDTYRKMIGWIKESAPDLVIKLSLESDDVKELVF